MSADNIEEAVDVLQQLGLKEYEARCFVGLTRLPTATAKELGEITEVPRTRVYDAIRMLEARGLVEVQHSSPKRFRAVALEEAAETLREQYEGRVERLQGVLDDVEGAEVGSQNPVQEVWSLAGQNAISNRTNMLVGEASDEVVLVLGDESVLTDALVDRLNGLDGSVDLVVGTESESMGDRIGERVTGATTFVSGLEWLREPVNREDGDEAPVVGRLLLVDRSSLLVSSLVPTTGEEHAVFGTGFGNGMVVIARRLMAQGLMRTVSTPGGE